MVAFQGNIRPGPSWPQYDPRGRQQVRQTQGTTAVPHMRLHIEDEHPEEEVSDADLRARREAGALKFAADRRIFPRREMQMHVNGRRLDHTIDARREPVLHLHVQDVSVGGLSAQSQTSLRIGERVAVFFPPQGPARGWDAYGRVLRSTPGRVGYKVALEFDPLPAA